MQQLQLPRGGCARMYVEHTSDTYEVCGYRSVALDETGSRILAIDAAGRVVLFDDAGRRVHEVATQRSDVQTEAFFGSGRAVALIGPRLLALDGATGDVLYDRVFEDNAGRPLQAVKQLTHRRDLLFISGWSPENARGSPTIVVDLASGAVVREQNTALPVTHLPALAWTIGYALSEDRPPRFDVLRADRDLSRLVFPEPCNAVGPEPRCVSIHSATLAGEVFDVATGERFAYDVKAIIGETSLWSWFTAGDRTLGLFRIGTSPSAYAKEFVVVDLRDARELFRFAAEHYSVNVAADQRGEPELRIAATQRDYQEPYVVRRVSLRGDVTVVGEAPRLEDLALVAPNGDIFLPAEDQPRRTRLIDAAGRTRGVFDFPVSSCSDHALWIRDDVCVISGDRARLAVIDEAGGISVFALPRRDER